MGGNGTFAAGNVAKYRWETVGTVHGVKVLTLKDKGQSRKLPEEAHSSRMYIQQHDDGTFSQLRIYDSKHRLRFEIGFHREPAVDKTGESVLHYHLYRPPSFLHGPAHPLTEAMRRKIGRSRRSESMVCVDPAAHGFMRLPPSQGPASPTRRCIISGC